MSWFSFRVHFGERSWKSSSYGNCSRLSIVCIARWGCSLSLFSSQNFVHRLSSLLVEWLRKLPYLEWRKITSHYSDYASYTKATVSCALWARGITGPYFFKNDAQQSVIVNGDRCRYLICSLPNWIEKQTSHTADSIDFLQETFDEHIASGNTPVNLCPKLCDLTTPLDHFLRGCLKSFCAIVPLRCTC